MKRFKSKISRVLVLYIVLFSSVVTLCLTSVQLFIDYKQGIKELHQTVEQIKLTNLDSITQSIWTIDYDSVQIQLNGLTRVSDVIFAEIRDENNILIAKSGKINTQNTITENIHLTQIYRGQKTNIGHLKIVATKENIYKNLIDTVVIILISQAIKTFLVSTFVLLIFYSMVTRHLEKIAAHAESIKLKSRTEPLIIDRGKHSLLKGDELERMVDSINIMSGNIYSSYHELINNEHILSEREAKFSAMFDSITDAIVFVDIDRNIIQTNSAFNAQFGYSLDEVQGKTTQLLYANPEQYGEQGKQRYNTNIKPAPTVYEIEYRRKDGSTFPSETMGGAVKLHDGTPLGFIGIIRDISSRKQSEEETQRLQKQLQQSQKMDAIGQLTGGIAHDFNNILASILGYSELMSTLLEGSSDQKLIKYIKHINKAGERARDLVAQLLAFSRSSPGTPEVINLAEVIQEVTSLIRPTIASSIDMVFEIDKDVSRVLMDKTQMHQIIMNLCINARDAMQDGNGTLTIRLRNAEYDYSICNSCNELVHGNFVELTIEDTGSGIQEDILETIFDPFKSTKALGEGTGMGLSVVHGILHKHMSHIIVETTTGSGTLFHILIPPYNGTDPTPVIKKDKPAISSGNNKNSHILVVDDEETVSRFMKDFLEDYNYKVTATTSSKQALEFIKDKPEKFDLIITDQTMPELTGSEMIKKIFEINPDIPTILCSGYNDQITEEEALKLGCARYLNKPVNNNFMIKTIQEILAGK